MNNFRNKKTQISFSLEKGVKAMAHCGNCGDDLDNNTGVCPCTCRNCKDIIYHHVLAYAQSYLDNCSVLEVTKALEIYFANDEVATARDLLRMKFADELKDQDICKVANRKSSPNRSVLEANASDVAEAVYALGNSEMPPRFVTFDLKKLPLLTPDLASVRTQAESVLLLNQKMKRVEEKLHEQTSLLVKQNDELGQCKMKLNGGSARPLLNAPKHDLQASVHSVQQLPAPAKDSATPNGPQVPRPGISYAQATKENAQEDTAKTSWEMQRQQRRRLRQRSGETHDSVTGDRNRRRAPALQGSAADTQVKASDGPNRDLWIFNVHKDMDDVTLRKYIEDGGSLRERKIQIRLWEARYKDWQDSKHFRLTIGKKDYEYVYKSEFWPIDVSVRKYFLSNDEKAQLKGNRDAAAAESSAL